jgi:hypothetical protein
MGSLALLDKGFFNRRSPTPLRQEQYMRAHTTEAPGANYGSHGELRFTKPELSNNNEVKKTGRKI